MAYLISEQGLGLLKLRPGTRLVIRHTDSQEHYMNFKQNCMLRFGRTTDIVTNEYQKLQVITKPTIIKAGGGTLNVYSGASTYEGDSKHYLAVIEFPGFLFAYAAVTSSVMNNPIKETPVKNIKVAPDKWDARFGMYKQFAAEVEKYDARIEKDITNQVNRVAADWKEFSLKLEQNKAMSSREAHAFENLKVISDYLKKPFHMVDGENPNFWREYWENPNNSEHVRKALFINFYRQTDGTMFSNDYVPTKGQYLKLLETGIIIPRDAIPELVKDTPQTEALTLFHHIFYAHPEYQKAYKEFHALTPTRAVAMAYNPKLQTALENNTMNSENKDNNNNDLPID